VAHEVEPNSAESGLRQSLQLCIGYVDWNERDAEIPTSTGLDGIFDRPIVRSMHDRLNDHTSLDAESLVEREQFLLGRLKRRGTPVDGIREARNRAEHMYMAITGVGR
jgi:hypothetical protein